MNNTINLSGLRSGYAYQLEGADSWKRSKDDNWEIVVIDALLGTRLGSRRIDDVRVDVYETTQGIYAQVAF